MRFQSQAESMSPEERRELKRKIVKEIEVQQKLIPSLVESSKPVPPDNAIGRLTRMEAISSRGASEASLNAARAKLGQLETALGKIDQPDFGMCRRCDRLIPHGRIMLVPESVLCVQCAEKKANS